MRMTALAAAMALWAAASGTARAHHQEIVLQLRGPLQAEFAGFYVADYQGFYDEGDVAVRIEPGGPGMAPAQALADGTANIAVAWLPEALAARTRGIPLVNIAQIFRRSGLGLTCRKSVGIATPADLAGKRLGVRPDGNPYPLRAWLKALGLTTDGAAAGVTLVDQGPGVGLLVDGTADCITTLRYDQYGQLVDAGLKPDELVVFDFQDQGVATLEDGLYVLADLLKDRDHVATLGAFLHQTMRGWLWARDNPVEAARIVLEYDTGHRLTEKPQVRMMEEINRLTAGTTGVLDPAAYQHTLRVLAAAGAGPKLSQPAKGATSHAVVDAANLAKLF